MTNNYELICFANYGKWKEAIQAAHLSRGYDRYENCIHAQWYQAQYVMAHALEQLKEGTIE